MTQIKKAFSVGNKPNEIAYIDTVADLRGYEPLADNQQVNLLGHTTEGIGGGAFYYDESDSSSADNDGTIIVTSGGARWKRQLDGFVAPEMFGCEDGVLNDSAVAASMQDAEDKDLPFKSSLSEIKFNTAKTTKAEIQLGSQSTLIYTGAAFTGSVLTMGDNASVQQGKNIDIRLRNDAIDWSNSSFIGLEIINYHNSKINYRNIFGFYIGVRELGDLEGFAYNEVTVGRLDSCVELMQWCSKGSGTPNGYHNENSYLKGRFMNQSAAPTGYNRVGVNCFSLDGVYENNNNNTMYSPSFELFDNGLPVKMQDGVQNKFLNFRDEANGSTFVEESGNSAENLYVEGYSATFAIVDKLTSTSTYRDSVYVPSRTKIKEQMVPLYRSGKVRDKVNYYQTSRINTRDMCLFEGSGGTNTAVDLMSNFTINSDSLAITSSSRGIGVSVQTDKCKRFAVRPKVAATGGRILIACYDSSGVLITPVSGDYLFTMQGRTFSPFTSSFSGYRYGTDIGGSPDEWYQFTLTDDVHSIDVILTGGSAELNVESFDIYHLATDDDAAPYVFLKACRFGENIGTGKPTQGTHKVGDRIINAAPTAGQPMGWECSVAGEFGVGSPAYVSLANYA